MMGTLENKRLMPARFIFLIFLVRKYTCFELKELIFIEVFRCGLDTDDFAFALSSFFITASCTVHETWTVYLDLWTVTCTYTWIILCRDIMHCSRDPQPLYSEKNIKNGFYGTIYTFKIYFTTVFSVFNKISCI